MANDRMTNRIAFRLAPGMALGARLKWIGALIVIGFAVQMAFSVLLGWLMILAGCLLGMLRGISNEPEDDAALAVWETTTIEELEGIEKLSRRIRGWRGASDWFRVTSGAGCGLIVLALLVLFASTAFIAFALDGVSPEYILSSPSLLFRPPLKGGLLSPIWVLDYLTMLIPIWLSGWMLAWEPPHVSQKAGYLLSIHSKYKDRPELEFLPSLLVSGEGERKVPRDCRLLVKLKDAPPDFIGIQVQISMNDVQGRKYPYCYSVIIAKKGFGLAERAGPLLEPARGGGILSALFKSSNDRKEAGLPQFDDSITEIESEEDVDVVVVRQITTGQGYHTTEEEALEVFRDALALAERIVKGHA